MKFHFSSRRMASAALLVASALTIESAFPSAVLAAEPCPQTDTEIVVSPGFCATVFADNIGHARQMTVAPDGTLYVNTWSGVYYNNDTPPEGGFLVALKDTKGGGRADQIARFGETAAEGGHGGTGIALYRDGLYAEINDRIVRYALKDGVVPAGQKPVRVLSGMPINGDHPMHPFTIDADGNLFVSMGSATNTCEVKNRMPHCPATILRRARDALASGATTPTRRIRCSRRRSAMLRASATARGWISTPPVASSSLNTAAINCTRIGLNSIPPRHGFELPAGGDDPQQGRMVWLA